VSEHGDIGFQSTSSNGLVKSILVGVGISESDVVAKSSVSGEESREDASVDE